MVKRCGFIEGNGESVLTRLDAKYAINISLPFEFVVNYWLFLYRKMVNYYDKPDFVHFYI